MFVCRWRGRAPTCPEVRGCKDGKCVRPWLSKRGPLACSGAWPVDGCQCSPKGASLLLAVLAADPAVPPGPTMTCKQQHLLCRCLACLSRCALTAAVRMCKERGRAKRRRLPPARASPSCM